jgi:hypothetical protein
MRIENFLHNCKQRTNQHISNDTKSTGTNKESSKPDVRSPDRREYRYVQLELQVREVTKAPKLSCVSPTRNCLIHHATTFLCFPLFFFSFICFFGKLQFGSFLVDMNTGTTLSDGSTDLQSSAPIDPCLSLIQSIYGVPLQRSGCKWDMLSRSSSMTHRVAPVYTTHWQWSKPLLASIALSLWWWECDRLGTTRDSVRSHSKSAKNILCVR